MRTVASRPSVTGRGGGRTVEAARATLDRYAATITGTSFQGYFRRHGNVVVHDRADPGAHEAGIVRCATRGR